jgi:hypothetical protein
MKLLSNPLVSGGLAAAAVAIVGYQFLSQRTQRGQPAPTPAPAAAAPVPVEPKPAPAPQAPAPQTSPAPAVAIDIRYGETHIAEWADAPARDPFQLIPVVAEKSSHQYPSPVAVWKLKGIWRQTGGRIAAINNRVYAEGDAIEGYKIKAIDADQVWFDGPDGTERLGFDKSAPPPLKPGEQRR